MAVLEHKPDFRIYDDGSLVRDPVLERVLAITVDEPVDGAAVAHLRLRDDLGEFSGKKSNFKIGNELRIELGYVGRTKEVFVGEVTAWRGDFSQRGQQSLTIVALDRFHRLRRNRRQRTFNLMKDSDAVDKVASECQLSTDLEPTPITQDSIQQWNQTDADFVLERASLFGYVAYVDDKKLHFHQPKLDAGPVAKLEWREEIQSFSTVVSLSQQQGKLKASAWNMLEKKPIEATVGVGDERDLMGGTKPGGTQVKPVDGDPTWVARTPAKTEEEVKAYATAAFRKRSERFLEARGTCEGDPKVRRDTVIDVKGIGEFLSGPYYVRRAIHSLRAGSGYTTTVTLIRTAVEAPAAPPQPVLQQKEPAERKAPPALLDPDWDGPQNPDGAVIVGDPAAPQDEGD